MSEPEFEIYLSLLSKFLRLNAAQKADIAEELRIHLEERLAELTAQGKSREEATRLALEDFGDAGALAWQFTRPHHIRRRRLIMRYSVGTFVTLAAIFGLVSLNWPARPDLPPAGNNAVAQADAPRATAIDPGANEREKQRAAIELKLASTDIEFKFDQTALQEAVDYLSQAIDTDVIFESTGDWNQAPVTLRARQGALSVKTALELMLRQASQGELAYAIKDGVILITDSSADYEVQVYDCRDLLAGVVVNGAASIGGGGGMGGGFFSVPPEMASLVLNQFGGNFGAADAPANVPTDVVATSPAGAALIAVLRQATRPAKWMPEDEPGGSITEFDGLLVVRHTQAVHRKIEDVLEKLRQAKQAQQHMALKQQEAAPPLVIPPGKRLVTLRAQNWEVPLNAIKPGRRVDVLKSDPAGRELEVILANAEIVLPNVTPLTAGGFGAPTSLQVNSVSLIVTPEEALQLQETELTTSVPLKFLLRGEEEKSP